MPDKRRSRSRLPPQPNPPCPSQPPLPYGPIARPAHRNYQWLSCFPGESDKAMRGGVVYDDGGQGVEVRGRQSGRKQQKDRLVDERRPLPVASYAQLSPADSTSTGSPYPIPQQHIHSGQPISYHLPYQPIPGSYPPQQHTLPHPHPGYNAHTYYPMPGEYEMYQTSGSGPSTATARGQIRHVLPPAFEEHRPEGVYTGDQPLLTTAALGRHYNTTIPQYYPVKTDRWGQPALTPDKLVEDVPATATKGKRKREAKHASPMPVSGKAVKTPKRAKSINEDGSVRVNKRAKRDEYERHEEQNQLPTPPSTGRGMVYQLPDHMQVPIEEVVPAPVETEEKKRGVVVTRSDQGRKLGLIGMTSADAELERSATPEEIKLSPRTKTVPALTIDTTGLAVYSTHEVLESEMAWLESGNGRLHSPPSSPDLMQLRTPAMAESVIQEDTPKTKAEKVGKRLELFKVDRIGEEAMVCTRIEMFGRVAVRKDIAVKFLGLDGGDERVLVEEREENEWVVSGSVGSSQGSVLVRPTWPDEEAPWATAGRSGRERRKREEDEKAELLRRYLDSASDDSEDEAEQSVTGRRDKGKGKSSVRLIRDLPGKRRLDDAWDNPADAKTALITAVRHRHVIVPGRIACQCGSSTPGLGSMIACSGCKTWHHLICCGLNEDIQLLEPWWCNRCQAEALGLATPSPSNTPRLSDERSSAFKGESMANIALAPSPMFTTGPNFARTAQTPLGRVVGSPTSRQHPTRILSYGTDIWQFTEDSNTPATPAPTRPDRFSTPRIDDAPFDVTSTPSRHLDFNFGQPSLFSLTPLGGRARIPSTVYPDGTPFRGRLQSGPATMLDPTRHDFLRDLNRDTLLPFTPGLIPASPQTRWPHQLMGAHNLSPSPFTHRRSFSGGGGKMSSMRNSSKSGLAATGERDEEMDEEKDEQ